MSPVASHERKMAKSVGSSSTRIMTRDRPDFHYSLQTALKNLDCAQMSSSLMKNSSAFGPTTTLRGAAKLDLL